MDSTRRHFLLTAARGVSVGLLGVGASELLGRSDRVAFYQIDAERCTSCGLCETQCAGSAVRCVNDFAKCGYCALCYGYYLKTDSEDPSNLVCQQKALIRRKVGDVQYEYTIDESRCGGCGKCVERCKKFGNASFRLEIRRDLCLECNRCSIGAVCPPAAIVRRPCETA